MFPYCERNTEIECVSYYGTQMSSQSLKALWRGDHFYHLSLKCYLLILHCVTEQGKTVCVKPNLQLIFRSRTNCKQIVRQQGLQKWTETK
jgi:hypothetical protein